MKKRILSGAQPSGQLHIGNYFGMIERMIRFQSESDLFCFVANYHSMTSINDKAELEDNTKPIAKEIAVIPISPGALINASPLAQIFPLFRDKKGIYHFADT